MTNLDGGNIKPGHIQPSDTTGHKIVITPVQETRYPTGRALAATFWASYFALHWLLILEVVEMNPRTGLVLVLHFVIASILSVNIAAMEYRKEKQ